MPPPINVASCGHLPDAPPAVPPRGHEEHEETWQGTARGLNPTDNHPEWGTAGDLRVEGVDEEVDGRGGWSPPGYTEEQAMSVIEYCKKRKLFFADPYFPKDEKENYYMIFDKVESLTGNNMTDTMMVE
eukprot:2708513-Pyramimonas_sp.AAC.1